MTIKRRVVAGSVFATPALFGAVGRVAKAAAASRVWAGIHFPSACQGRAAPRPTAHRPSRTLTPRAEW